MAAAKLLGMTEVPCLRIEHMSCFPFGKAFGGLNEPVAALRDASPQMRHHFTQADQVNQLVGASEADAEFGFTARLLALCSLPRTPSCAKTRPF